MAAIVRTSTLVEQIDQWWFDNADNDPRPHMGGSLIGTDCERALFYTLRWASKVEFPGRILRLFDRGHSEEARFIRDLKAVGIPVFDRDPETGRQYSFSALGGHFAGSLDGMAMFEGLPTVLEFKTSADKPFQDMVKNGVQKSKPLHFAQMQKYMGWAGVTQALYMMVNKNDDSYYVELVQYDADVDRLLLEKAERVINATTPPSRISTSPSAIECRFCDHHATCHGDTVGRVSCRTCISATPRTDDAGGWHCEHHNLAIPLDVQRTACPDHRFIPALIPFGENPQANGRDITYQLIGSDKTFTNGPKGSCSYDSRELQELTEKTVCEQGIEALRETFDGRVTELVKFDDSEIPF